ncbi:copper chaperone CopZ [Wenyingzhuangia heitensis]|uniref:Copper chaperone CopZ n=1 Tax=Wenyingzhuangia heitensis TaxID=1487859 RepID=A0ABX0U6E6_9FLAO|nr:hypothetical protein [Wenyingzhuangia heitensis]NIJ43929.1 copper chaperone CopZ [Wenyingzhuangia heitensis]
MIKNIIFFFTLLILTACTNQGFNQQNTMVPNTNVNFSISTPSFISLSGIGNYHIEAGQGFMGVIVFNIDGNTFRAFDLGCPYVNPNECQVPMTIENGTGEMSCANCANDDITFTQQITGVTIGEGDSEKTYYLREYSAFLENGSVRITNF